MDLPERLDLEVFLADLKREPQPILFIPNRGNAGDALIAHVTRQMFDRLGLDYVWLNDTRRIDPRGRVVVYGGGGNLIPLYHDAERALRWANGRAKRVILLPHTVSGHEELLAALGPETELICRELVSYAHVRAAVRAAHCHLADDLALSADARATLAEAPSRPSALSLYARRLLYRLALHPSRARSVASPRKLRQSDQLFDARRTQVARGGAPTVLHVYRTDAERTEVTAPPDNLDLSELFSFGMRDASVTQIGAQHLLRYLDTFDEVRTNRLHVAIGGAVLGKRVTLHPGSYFKNRAVYEYSLRDRFSNVEWGEAAQSGVER